MKKVISSDVLCIISTRLVSRSVFSACFSSSMCISFKMNLDFGKQALDVSYSWRVVGVCDQGRVTLIYSTLSVERKSMRFVGKMSAQKGKHERRCLNRSIFNAQYCSFGSFLLIASLAAQVGAFCRSKLKLVSCLRICRG